VVQSGPIHIKDLTRGIEHTDVARNRIKNLAPFPDLLPEHVLRKLRVVNGTPGRERRRAVDLDFPIARGFA
jgi:hypothetical protein